MTTEIENKKSSSFKEKLNLFVNDMFIFPLYILTHPIKGFEQLKYDKKGKAYVAIIYVILLVFATILSQTSSGFFINPFPEEQVNLLKTASLIIFPILIAAIGNWSVTSLMDGKGRVTEILMVICYGLIPFVWFSFPLTIVSNFLILEEITFFNAFLTLSIVLSAYKIFMGLLVIHEFGLLKTLFTIIFTIVAIAIIIFIGLLILTLFQQVFSFVSSVYKEFLLRIR